MKKLTITLSLAFFCSLLFAQTEVTIYEIQGQQALSPYEGQIIKTYGIVTGTFPGSYFIQDGEGEWNGVYVYSGDDVTVGDEVELTAEVDEFFDLTELKSVSSLTILSSGNTLPNASWLSTEEISDEAYEGVLVKVENAICSNDNAGYGEWELDDGSGFCRVDDMGVVYSPVLGLSYTVTGPLNYSFDFYKIEPRDESDIQINENLYFISDPEQVNPDKISITLNWETNVEASTEIFWGNTPELEQGHVQVMGNTLFHEIQLIGVLPSSILYIRSFSVSGDDTTSNFTRPYATVSNSSGVVKLYFNHDVDHTVATEEMAVWTTNIVDTVIHYFDMAQQTLDITMYEQESDEIVEAINAAYDRGVLVRYITDSLASNDALENLNENIPVLFGNDNGIMHDKFIVIDAQEEMNAWVITGSLNHTENNLGWDFNNMICMQDKSLSLGFTLEFEEMWGSAGPMYDELNARFGGDKLDNTPHIFLIDDIPVEAYFSPSDNTTMKIKTAIDQAQSNIEFGIMVFTENSLGDAIVDAQQRGLEIDGVIDYVEYTGSEYEYLKDYGVNVRDYANPDGTSWPDGPVFHHKYVLMDFQQGDANPIVITGSHNWSASAESINDENTLIIHDANIANQFHQEFKKRFNDMQTPIAVDDDTTANTNEWVSVDYLVNDFSPEDVTVGREIIQLPLNGDAGLVDGKIDYISYEDFSGKDSLQYRLYNLANILLADTAWVRIQVGENSIGEFSSVNFTVSNQFINKGILSLDVFSKKAEVLHISLFNINGKHVTSTNTRVINGENKVHVNVGTLSKGIYLLDVSSPSGRLSTKLIY